MIKEAVKTLIVATYPLANHINKYRKKSAPFLCIITPVFDPALASVKLMVRDLKRQTFTDFKQVLISNGPSPKTKEFIKNISKKDKRFKYVELTRELQNTGVRLQNNLGKRKNYAMKKYEAKRYVFIDADSKIIDHNFIAKLYMADILLKKDIIVAQIKLGNEILPVFPLDIARIDMTNYIFSRKIALKETYPMRLTKDQILATDWRFFLKINKKNNTSFLDSLYLVKDARRSYQSVRSFIRKSN